MVRRDTVGWRDHHAQEGASNGTAGERKEDAGGQERLLHEPPNVLEADRQRLEAEIGLVEPVELVEPLRRRRARIGRAQRQERAGVP